MHSNTFHQGYHEIQTNDIYCDISISLRKIINIESGTKVNDNMVEH